MLGLIAVLEICSDKNTGESVVGTFKNICTVAVHCWYIKDVFAEFCQQISKFWLLKDTSATKQKLLKMCHLRHWLRIFLLHRKVMFRSRDVQLFVFLTILWFSKSVMSWWVCTRDRVHFGIYLFNHNSLTHQTWPIYRYT